MALCNISYAETLFKKVSYFHSKTFDSQTLRYPCCGGDQASQGCQKHSRRKQGEINQAEHALQQAATQLAEIKNEKPKEYVIIIDYHHSFNHHSSFIIDHHHSSLITHHSPFIIHH